MLTFNKYINEIEYICILGVLILPFIVNLYHRVLRSDVSLVYSSNDVLIPLDASKILKAICCIIIPIHHYGIFFCESRFVNIIRLAGGDVALVLFLLLSAYGVLKSEQAKRLTVVGFIKTRLMKIYVPFVIITTITVLLAILVDAKAISPYPTNMSDDLVSIAAENNALRLVYMSCGIIEIDSSLWFVWVILVSYIIFIFSKSIFDINYQKKQFLLTYIILILLYGLLCRFVISTPIHYYRNLWALVLGTIIALYEKELIINWIKGLLLLISVVIYLWAQIILMKEPTYFIYAILGLTMLLVMCLYTKTTTKPLSKYIVVLSSISYYIYLFHEKVFVFFNYYMGKTNVLPPLILIIIIAYIYNMLRTKIFFLK